MPNGSHRVYETYVETCVEMQETKKFEWMSTIRRLRFRFMSRIRVSGAL